jgi:serine phosphatase RsbU (regulator of sigma subunit)
MRFAWVEELLPRSVVSTRSEIWWLLFFVLFPLAYVGGVSLEMAQESPASMAGFQDRAASIRTAEQFAASKGYSVAGWHQYVIAETNESLLAYYAANKNPATAAASSLAPGQEIQVLFRSPDQSHEFRTYLSLTGRVTGYDFGKSTQRSRQVSTNIGTIQINTDTTTSHDDDESSMKNAIMPTDMEAEAIARKTLANNPALSQLVKLGKADVTSDEGDSARRQVTWEATPPQLSGLTLKIAVSVRDSQVVAQHIEGKVDNEHRAKSRKLPWVLNFFYGSFLCFGVLYSVFRYAKRTLQKEVSHLRTLVLAFLFAISFATLFYSVAVDQIATRVSGEDFSKIGLAGFATGLISCAFCGLLVGIAYGSGEGEVREAYPGKLTSLDALLAGRILSRDVAASFLFGAAAAGWLLLCHNAIRYFLKVDVSATRVDVLGLTFARLPWLTLLVGRQYNSILIAVTGLLLPAAFLVRRTVRKARRFAWLIVFALLSVTHDAAANPTWESTLLAMAVLVCALLLPFFAYDLLAAIVSLSALSFVEELARLSAVFPSWRGLAALLLALAVVLMACCRYLSLRGKRVREEDVRPLYAKNLAERMSLQAEVLAAREAQLRLLPQAAPELPGIEMAACCLPARDVGGDFYDFFPLDANRIGLFIAQGSDQGLASALCIALAKGVLMHSSLQPNSPTQTIVNLEATIGELLEGGIGGRISFAYAEMDTRRNVLSYARLGSSPRVVVYREGAGLTTSALLEGVVNVPDRLRNATPIFEGSAHVAPGDFLIFFTKGVTSLRSKRFGKTDYQWVDVLMRDLGRPEEPLQQSLLAALTRHHNRASDDLTAIVLRVLKRQAFVQEVVA